MPKLLFASLLVLITACAGTAPQASRTTPPDTTLGRATSAPLPAEDVTKYRATYPAPKLTPVAAPSAARPAPVPTNQVNEKMEQRLRDQAYTNQNVKYAPGFRILAYLGIEREQAMAIRRAVIAGHPEQTDYLSYKAPVYRLYIGDYLTRLEAARALAWLRPLTQKAELEAMPVLLNKQ